jgi:hypothetical protein
LLRRRFDGHDLRKPPFQRGHESSNFRRAARQERESQERVALLRSQGECIAPALEVLRREVRLALPDTDDEDMRHSDLLSEGPDGESLALQCLADESIQTFGHARHIMKHTVVHRIGS